MVASMYIIIIHQRRAKSNTIEISKSTAIDLPSNGLFITIYGWYSCAFDSFELSFSFVVQ